MNEVLTHRVGRVQVITIDRPDAYNALNANVIAAIEASVLSAAVSPEIGAVVITGSGQKAFCAGADLKELQGMSADTAAQTLTRGQQAFRNIEQSGIPVITAVNGLALGGGFELILASTFSIMSTKATFGLPEASLGLIPGYGGTQRLHRILGKPMAAYLMLTGKRMSASQAFEHGLTPIPPVDPEELVDAAVACAHGVSQQAPKAVRAILKALDTAQDADLDTGLAVESGLAALAAAGAESDEGISAFLEKRQPVYVPQTAAIGER